MNIKLIFKVSVLLFALVLVIAGRKFFSSSGFQQKANDVFATEAKSFQWCSADRKIFVWTEPLFMQKYKNQPQANLAKRFCLLMAETIQGVDLKTVDWTQIATSVDSEGQTVVLEWNKEKNLFRADGLPFKSSSLSREINP